MHKVHIIPESHRHDIQIASRIKPTLSLIANGRYIDLHYGQDLIYRGGYWVTGFYLKYRPYGTHKVLVFNCYAIYNAVLTELRGGILGYRDAI